MEEVTESLADIVERLREALAEPKSLIARDAAIKRFELCVELAWKALQKHLAAEGIVCASPRRCLEEAFKLGLVEDDAGWPLLLADRNLSVHTYDEKLAEELHARLPSHLTLLSDLAGKLKSSSAGVM